MTGFRRPHSTINYIYSLPIEVIIVSRDKKHSVRSHFEAMTSKFQNNHQRIFAILIGAGMCTGNAPWAYMENLNFFVKKLAEGMVVFRLSLYILGFCWEFWNFARSSSIAGIINLIR